MGFGGFCSFCFCGLVLWLQVFWGLRVLGLQRLGFRVCVFVEDAGGSPLHQRFCLLGTSGHWAAARRKAR